MRNFMGGPRLFESEISRRLWGAGAFVATALEFCDKEAVAGALALLSDFR